MLCRELDAMSRSGKRGKITTCPSRFAHRWVALLYACLQRHALLGLRRGLLGRRCAPLRNSSFPKHSSLGNLHPTQTNCHSFISQSNRKKKGLPYAFAANQRPKPANVGLLLYDLTSFLSLYHMLPLLLTSTLPHSFCFPLLLCSYK